MSVRRGRVRASAAGLAACLLVLAMMISGCAGQSYSCGTATANHCYGVVKWSGSPTGFSMEETPVALTSGSILVDDEGWLVDYPPVGNVLDASWVETGEENEGYGTVYFWADNTPFDGFMTYPLGSVAPSDERGAWIAYTIRQDASTPTQWDVTISRAASGTVLYSAAASEIPMKPNAVEEGQELAGQQDAQAPLAFFSYNEVFQGSAETVQTNDGTVQADRPPNAGWLGSDTPSNTSSPSNPEYGTGGLFFTDCC